MSDLADTLRRHFDSSRPEEVVAVYLFGSQASGRAHRDSDVDVAVLFDRAYLPSSDDRSRAALRLNTDLIAATHHNDIDVVVLNDVSPELADHAIESGVRVYCGNEEAAFRFALQTRLRHFDLAPFLRRMRRIKAESLRS